MKYKTMSTKMYTRFFKNNIPSMIAVYLLLCAVLPTWTMHQEQLAVVSPNPLNAQQSPKRAPIHIPYTRLSELTDIVNKGLRPLGTFLKAIPSDASWLYTHGGADVTSHTGETFYKYNTQKWAIEKPSEVIVGNVGFPALNRAWGPFNIGRQINVLFVMKPEKNSYELFKQKNESDNLEKTFFTAISTTLKIDEKKEASCVILNAFAQKILGIGVNEFFAEVPCADLSAPYNLSFFYRPADNTNQVVSTMMSTFCSPKDGYLEAAEIKTENQTINLGAFTAKQVIPVFIKKDSKITGQLVCISTVDNKTSEYECNIFYQNGLKGSLKKQCVINNKSLELIATHLLRGYYFGSLSKLTEKNINKVYGETAKIDTEYYKILNIQMSKSISEDKKTIQINVLFLCNIFDAKTHDIVKIQASNKDYVEPLAMPIIYCLTIENGVIKQTAHVVLHQDNTFGTKKLHLFNQNDSQKFVKVAEGQKLNASHMFYPPSIRTSEVTSEEQKESTLLLWPMDIITSFMNEVDIQSKCVQFFLTHPNVWPNEEDASKKNAFNDQPLHIDNDNILRITEKDFLDMADGTRPLLLEYHPKQEVTIDDLLGALNRDVNQEIHKNDAVLPDSDANYDKMQKYQQQLEIFEKIISILIKKMNTLNKDVQEQDAISTEKLRSTEETANKLLENLQKDATTQKTEQQTFQENMTMTQEQFNTKMTNTNNEVVAQQKIVQQIAIELQAALEDLKQQFTEMQNVAGVHWSQEGAEGVRNTLQTLRNMITMMDTVIQELYEQVAQLGNSSRNTTNQIATLTQALEAEKTTVTELTTNLNEFGTKYTESLKAVTETLVQLSTTQAQESARINKIEKDFNNKFNRLRNMFLLFAGFYFLKDALFPLLIHLMKASPAYYR
jgi:hypothetical protein